MDNISAIFDIKFFYNNNLLNNIYFLTENTFEIENKNQLSFLSVLIMRNFNKLVLDIFTKDTDSQRQFYKEEKVLNYF